MSTVLPDPVPLDPPPGSPAAVDEAAQATSLAARLLDEVTDGLTSAGTPSWHGRDADAAEGRRTRIARIAEDAAEALHRVALRLAGHADVLREVGVRTAVLRAAQDAEFTVARSRVAVSFDAADPLAESPELVLGALRAAEADRAVEHARLTARLGDDAAETIQVLSAATAVVTGTARSDADAALLHLAALLPAWGAPQVARRGFLLALAVRGRGPDDEGMSTEELLLAAREDLDLAAEPAYAAAFLGALGADLARTWLTVAWGGAPADDPRTELFARVLSGLDRGSTGPPWLPDLLDGAAVTGELGMVAGGLGAVLARAKATGLAGPPPAVAAAWARTLLREERSTGHPTDLGVPPAGADPESSDPVALLAGAVADQSTGVEAARLMSDPGAWEVVLSRFWNDSSIRDSLITTVADAPADVAEPALRSSLVALGTGLADGDPDDSALYLLEPRIKDVAPVLAAGWLRHSDVLVRPLDAAAAGTADAVSLTALRGLAVTVALDEGTADGPVRGEVGDQIARALARPHPRAVPVGGAPPEIALPAAFAAVREHGARLAHAMSQHVLRDEAQARATIWDWTMGLPFTAAAMVPGWGVPAVVAETVVASTLGADGTWANTPDRQRHHPASEAVGAAVTGVDRGDAPAADAARMAFRTYSATLRSLGTPAVPRGAPADLGTKIGHAVTTEIAGGWVGRRLRLGEPVGGIVGGAVVERVEGLVPGLG